MDFPTTSPIIQDAEIVAPKRLNFYDALREMVKGNKVTRDEWDERRNYYLIKDGLLSLHKMGEADEVCHPFALTDRDITSEDWYVL